jgi:hypothetical protein
MFEVLRNKFTNGESKHEVFVETVDENNLALGSRCPVHVKMSFSDDSFPQEMNGEIICPHFAKRHGSDEIVVTYTVKLLAEDGGILIEEGVAPNRIRYQYGLDRLRANLRRKYGTNKMMAIRTGSVGLPVRKRQVCLQQSTKCLKKKPVFVHAPASNVEKTYCPLSSLKVKSARNYPTKEVGKDGKHNQKSLDTLPPQNICKNGDCSCHEQKGCNGYCFKHYYFMLRNIKVEDNDDVKEQTEQTTKSDRMSVAPKQKTESSDLVDLTMD